MKQPVKIRGVVYESQAAAARALGVSDATVSQALDRGTPDLIGTYKAGNNRGHSHKPVTIDGITYESQAEAARQLRCSRASIRKKYVK